MRRLLSMEPHTISGWKMEAVQRVMKLVLGMILAAATGCVRAPCGIMKANGWSCNLEIVDPLKPGQLVYVERGTFQPLPIKVPDPSCAESNAVRGSSALRAGTWG